ncbi:MAG TPA: VWA domain-containing protein [Pyrinomonadaceae bacterium]|nr:VWA domain-containing protein [Pyrinomonadaceae bacterium]
MLRLLIARTLRRVALLGALLLVAAFVTFAMLLPTTHAQQTDSRPRRVVNNNQQPRPTTTTSTTTTSQTAQQPTPTPAPKPQGPTLQVKPSSQATPTPTPTPEGQEIDPNELITVDTNLVNLNVRVIDRNNRPVHDVQQADFRIFEDNVPQEIKFFTREEVPISYGLVVDNSGSMRPLLNQVIDASKTIINSNKTGDETFLVRFIDREKIEVLQDFTPDENALMDALDNLYIEGGQTAIIDAVLLSAERVANYKKGNDLNDRRRRALILVTDGEDRFSYYKESELFARLREMDVQIYVIGFTGELDAQNGGLIRKSTKDKAVNLINKLATETGGRAFFPSSISELPQIAQDITRDLRTQYVIGYYPTNKARDGQFHAIRVAVAGNDKRDKRIAITRTGRIATAGNINAAAPNRNKLTPPERKP